MRTSKNNQVVKSEKVYNEAIRKNIVYRSNNYDLIEIFEYNRYTGIGTPIINGQEKDFETRLKKAMKMLENGFSSHTPILCGIVNNKLIAAEGNTRLVAAKKLGIPFYYEIDETLDTVAKISSVCFKINNTGTKWNAKDKIAHAVIDPSFTDEQKTNAMKIVELSNKYGIALSTVLYVASNGKGHKADVLAKKDFRIAFDTEEILSFAQIIAINNFDCGLSLLKRDKFVESLMRAIRSSNSQDITKSNLLKRARFITDQKGNRAEWNKEVEKAANFGLHSGKNKVHLS